MKLINNCFSVFIIIIYLVLGSCKPEDAPKNPCDNSHAVSASFLIEEDWDSNDFGAGNWEYYDTDTVCTYRVKLTANEDGASYRWHISGDTVVFTQKSFTITFPNRWVADQAPRDIPVTLIVNKSPDKRCFPNDDGVDTFTRTIHFVNVITGTLVKGHFFGYWDGNSADTSTIFITIQDSIHSNRRIYAYNLSPKFNTTSHGYGDYTYENAGVGYREIICSVNGGEYSLSQIRLSKDNTVNIVCYDWRYTFPSNTSPEYIHHFTGIKINDQ